MANSWFRMYSEAVDDEKLRLLAFEDRWHFVAILCCKNSEILDNNDPLLRRKVALKLGLDLATLDEVARRLSEVGLIDRETLQPLKWDERQFKSDSSKERVQRYREKQKKHEVSKCNSYGNVTVTCQESDTDTDTDTDIKKHLVKKSDQIRENLPEVTEQTFTDFLQLRKAKKSPLTIRAIENIRSEASKAGISLETALIECCARGWVGFKAEWYQKAQAPPAYQTKQQLASVAARSIFGNEAKEKVINCEVIEHGSIAKQLG